jgi:arabinose-5-phosphate isomerase
LIAQKITATFASLGTPSHFLHPADALHGDLGRIHPRDLVLAFSFSGATEELVRILPRLRDFGNPLLAVTGRPDSPLGKAASVVIDLGPIQEACPLGLAPSSSTVAMLALGDALALVVSQRRRFSPADFVRFHPGGSLGRKLTKVEEIMRPRSECRVAPHNLSVRQVLVKLSRPGRRTGAIMLVDEQDRLSGLFTDSDLARLLEHQRDDALDAPIALVMTRSPKTLQQGDSLEDALQLLAGRKLSELPVIDGHGSPCGMIDITDVVAYLPREPRGSDPAAVRATHDSVPACSSLASDLPSTIPLFAAEAPPRVPPS